MSPLSPELDEALCSYLSAEPSQLDEKPKHEMYGGKERLTVLGEKILEVTATFHLFAKRPSLEAGDITLKRNDYLAAESLDAWLVETKLTEKLTTKSNESGNDLQKIRSLFAAYVAGVFLEIGPQGVQDWISSIIDPTSVSPTMPGQREQMQSASKSSSVSSDVIDNVPDTRTAMSTSTHTSTPANRVGPMLPQFNAISLTRRVKVEWVEESTGPAHRKSWIVKCIVDGITQGEGTGVTKKEAKEDAAQKAFVALKWDSTFDDKPNIKTISGASPSHVNRKGNTVQTTGFLALFNQLASQMRPVPVISWEAGMAGDAHQPYWTIRCRVDGEVQGEGTTSSKQTAKEEAAKHALVNLGWM